MNDPTCDVCGSQVRYESIKTEIYKIYYCLTHYNYALGCGINPDNYKQKTYNVPSSHQPVSIGALKHWQ